MKARDNPFRSERVLQVTYQLRGLSWEQLLARCRELRYRAAIIGPHGAGKTTLLEALEPRLRQEGFSTRFIRLDAEQRVLAPGALQRLCAGLSSKQVLLFDGAEQMSPLTWHWFRWRTRGTGGLLITTHRAGRLPTLWQCSTSVELLAGIAAGLLQADPGSVYALAAGLFARHQGNLREALREWYDLVAMGSEVPTAAYATIETPKVLSSMRLEVKL